MLVSSLLVSTKLTSKLFAADMVNSWFKQNARRGTSELFGIVVRRIFDSLQNIASTPASSNKGYERLASNETEDEKNHLQQAASTEYLVYNWLESLFAWFQVIVLWHEPKMSLCAISGLLSSFLLLTYFAPRFYATIMIALFVYNLNKFWFRHVWPSIRVPPTADREDEQRLDVDRFTYLHPQLMTLAELGQHSSNLIQVIKSYLGKILQLRQRNPLKFCSTFCSILFCTAYIGNRVSGFCLVFWILAIVLTAPGIYYHLLPEPTRNWLKVIIFNLMNKISEHSQTFSSKDCIGPVRTAILSEQPIAKLIDYEDDQQTSNDKDSTVTAPRFASGTKSQALSFLEHFKQRSFSFGAAQAEDTIATLEPETTTHSNSNDNQAAISTSLLMPLTTGDMSLDNQYVQQTNELGLISSRGADASTRLNEENDGNTQSAISISERAGSNSSASLLDLDDDQQDGFVLL